MNVSNINFKGAAITPHDGKQFNNTFTPEILAAYTKTLPGRNDLDKINSNNAAIPLSNNEKLSLWGDDSDLFSSFLEQNHVSIPVSHQDLGLETGEEIPKLLAYTRAPKTKKLAQALITVLDIPKVLTQEALATFISDVNNLRGNILSPEILQEALAKIIKK